MLHRKNRGDPAAPPSRCSHAHLVPAAFSDVPVAPDALLCIGGQIQGRLHLNTNEKRARADYVIDTSRGFKPAEAEVGRIVEELTSRTR